MIPGFLLFAGFLALWSAVGLWWRMRGKTSRSTRALRFISILLALVGVWFMLGAIGLLLQPFF